MSKQPLKSGERVLLITFGAIFFAAIAGYGALEAMRIRSDKPVFVQRTHFDFSVEGKRGSEIYLVSRCNSCHRALRQGTNMGLALDGLGSKHSLDWIENFLRDPENVYGAPTIDHGAAPKEAAYVAKLPPQDLHAIAIFLSELKADRGAADAEAPPEGRSEFIDNMIEVWAPDSWKNRFEDVRDRRDSQAADSQKK